MILWCYWPIIWHIDSRSHSRAWTFGFRGVTLSLHFHLVPAKIKLSLSSLLPWSSLHQIKLNSLSFHNQAPPMHSPPRALSLDTIFIKFHAWPPLPSLKVRCLFHLLDYPRSGPRDLVSQHAKLDSYSFLLSQIFCVLRLVWGFFVLRCFQWVWELRKCLWGP